ncbi:MAG TPA: glucosidase, partial [Myxococcaceae bacterium]|nr:glucosidase [Myxococcaceae bacterium]
VFEENLAERLPTFTRNARNFLLRHPELTANLHMPSTPGVGGRRMISIVDERKLRRILARMLDETEFLGPHGIRALSRHHLEHPYVFQFAGQEFRVGYVPGDSDSGMFGGNSNWRGPVWMPVNMLLWAALLRLGAYYGDTFKVECPTGSGREMNLFEVARELAERLIRTFTRDASGRRPVYGGSEKFQTDPHWRDCILFYEYFHGDNGAGIGASHQTGWTGAVARVIQLSGALTAADVLAPEVERKVFRLAGR